MSLLIAVCLLSSTAQAKYGGGTGDPNNPYQIATAEDLMLLGDSTEDYDKYFILTTDIDMDPNLPGGKVFDKAVIASDTDPADPNSIFQGTPFTGTFEGNGNTISHLTIEGASYLGLFGRLKFEAEVKNLGLVDVNITGSGNYIGGLAGYNEWAVVNSCFSTGEVRGSEAVGVFMGANSGTVYNCYSKGAAMGNGDVGGFVGRIGQCQDGGCYCGSIYNCYSAGLAIGVDSLGGIVGSKKCGGVIDSFWDIEASGWATSAGGTGETTSKMQTAGTFLDAGWDFMDEMENGTEEIWWILEGTDYPRLIWELPEGLRLRPLPAFYPYPQDGAREVVRSTIMLWTPASPTLKHDIYFGEEKEAVANATTDSPSIYRGRQAAELTSYDPGILEWGKTYYWRIDEVNDEDSNSPWKGNVWSFTTANFLIVEDFESYNDLDPFEPESRRIYVIWVDGFDNPERNGSIVGPLDWGDWQMIVHSGMQSMPFYYDNSGPATYSEATADIDNLAIGRDWTIEGVGILSLWFRGYSYNAAEPMYVVLANDNGPPAIVYHDNPNAAQIEGWTEWAIDLQEFADQDLHLANVNTITIGFGDKNNPQSGGSGKLWFDDIRLYRPSWPYWPAPVVPGLPPY